MYICVSEFFGTCGIGGAFYEVVHIIVQSVCALIPRTRLFFLWLLKDIIWHWLPLWVQGKRISKDAVMITGQILFEEQEGKYVPTY